MYLDTWKETKWQEACDGPRRWLEDEVGGLGFSPAYRSKDPVALGWGFGERELSLHGALLGGQKGNTDWRGGRVVMRTHSSLPSLPCLAAGGILPTESPPCGWLYPLPQEALSGLGSETQAG